MHMTKVKFERVRNLGNYESERVGCEVELEGSAPILGLKYAKKFVHKELGIGPTEADINHAKRVLEEAE